MRMMDGIKGNLLSVYETNFGLHQCLYSVSRKHTKTGEYSLVRDSDWVTSQDVQVVASEERALRVAIMTGYPRKGHSILTN